MRDEWLLYVLFLEAPASESHQLPVHVRLTALHFRTEIGISSTKVLGMLNEYLQSKAMGTISVEEVPFVNSCYHPRLDFLSVLTDIFEEFKGKPVFAGSPAAPMT